MSTLELPRAGTIPDLVPVRMLNEFTYCPRLAYLEWVQGEWAENVETLEGSHVHRRVDKQPGPKTKIHDRSVKLSSQKLGLVGVLDLIETDGRRVRPVDYKRGKKPPVAEGAWEPERVQLCAQGLLLREHGYQSHEGVLWFAGSRERVRVRFTEQLVERTLELLGAMRSTLSNGTIPAPLEDSPKCPRCSLVSICLPAETNFLRHGGEVRPISVAEPDAHALVVQEPGSKVRLCGSRLRVVVKGEEQASVPLLQISQLVLMSNSSASEPALVECCRRNIPVVHMSGSGWLHGITRGTSHKNVELRAEQFAAARDEVRRLPLAQAIVAAKIWNGRVLLRRNGSPSSRDLVMLERLSKKVEGVRSAEELLGIEGSAGGIYWSAFPTMLKRETWDDLFDFEGRNRRPPKDPVNALVSFVNALLCKDWVTTLESTGFDPYMGFYHRAKYGKPALALDMMEPFRPVVADSVVIGVWNNGEVGEGDFFGVGGGVLLTPQARKRVIEAYERRLEGQIRHPVFGYRCSYRRIFEIEARLLGRALTGELERYEPFRVR